MCAGVNRHYFKKMNFAERSKAIFEQEIAELKKVADTIGEEMNLAIEIIYACPGKLVVMGVGKTGTIGHKISSSLASTGTPSILSTQPRLCTAI